MKTVLATVAALAALSTVAFASPEPRCWYGANAPACRSFQSTNSTAVSDPAHQDRKGQGVREFDHNRETTRPY